MRAVIYGRLSARTDKNAMNLVDQVKRCREWADRHGWSVVAEFTDYGESAFERDSMDDRPGFGQLLNLIKDRQVDAVLAWHSDRMFRDPIEQAMFFRECVRCGVRSVATVQEGERDPNNPSDEMVGSIVAAVGRYESNVKRQRILAKHRQIAEAGRSAGGGVRPFGYAEDRLTVVPAEAKLIKKAAKQIIAGKSLREVTRMMDASGIPSSTGGAWTMTVVRRMLTGARWAGLRAHRGQIVTEAVWPAILTVDELTQLRAILLDPARRTSTIARPYLLTGGLAVCGLCGAALVSRPRGDGERCYVCATGKGFKGCGKIRRLSQPVEDEVVGRLMIAIDDGLLVDAEPEPGPDLDGVTIAELEAALNGLAKDHYVLKVISRSEFLAAREPIAKQIELLQARITTPKPSEMSFVQARQDWETMTHDQRRAVLRNAMEAVVFHPARRGLNKFDPTLIEIRWKD